MKFRQRMTDNYDIEIYTDGSGHINGFGGWAAFITTPDRIKKDFRMGSACCTSVDRMEFTALLEGLQGAWEMVMQRPEYMDPDWKPNILWFSDRESLVNSVKGIYGRTNCPDLWQRFDFYEANMIINPRFVTEEIKKTLVEFKEVDLQSSVGYQMIKNYISSKPFSTALNYNQPTINGEF